MEPVLENEITQLVQKTVPAGKWQIVDVVFPATGGTDCVIRHSLSPASPYDVHYTVLRTTTGGDVYEPQGATAKPWTKDYIVLRSATNSWKGRLLLSLLKTNTPFIPSEIV